MLGQSVPVSHFEIQIGCSDSTTGVIVEPQKFSQEAANQRYAGLPVRADPDSAKKAESHRSNCINISPMSTRGNRPKKRVGKDDHGETYSVGTLLLLGSGGSLTTENEETALPDINAQPHPPRLLDSLVWHSMAPLSGLKTGGKFSVPSFGSHPASRFRKGVHSAPPPCGYLRGRVAAPRTRGAHLDLSKRKHRCAGVHGR